MKHRPETRSQSHFQAHFACAAGLVKGALVTVASLCVSAEPKLHLFGRYENDSISANTRFSFSSERPSQRRLIRPEVTCFREVRLVDTLADAAESGAHLRMAPMPFPQHFQTGKIHAYSDRRSHRRRSGARRMSLLRGDILFIGSISRSVIRKDQKSRKPAHA